MDIQNLVDRVHQTAVAKGWWAVDETHRQRSVGDLLALVHSEVSEALEEWRNRSVAALNDPGNPAPERLVRYLRNDGKPEGFVIELADVIIRVLDICGHYKLNIEDAIEQKIQYNETRPHRHGGKTA